MKGLTLYIYKSIDELKKETELIKFTQVEAFDLAVRLKPIVGHDDVFVDNYGSEKWIIFIYIKEPDEIDRIAKTLNRKGARRLSHCMVIDYTEHNTMYKMKPV